MFVMEQAKLNLAYSLWLLTMLMLGKADGQTQICSLELVLTPSLTTKLASDVQKRHQDRWTSLSKAEHHRLLVNEVRDSVTYMVDFANGILKKYPLASNSFQITVKRIKILNETACTYRGVDYCGGFNALFDVIERHSLVSHDDVCLSYVLTNTADAKGHLGRAFLASQDPESGGTCDKFGARSRAFTSHEDEMDTSSGASLNTGVVSFRHVSRGQMSLETVAVVFAHEIGHSFGSPHDYPRRCLLDQNGGSFLMHPSVVQGVTGSYQHLSPCSVANMSSVLARITRSARNCFRPDLGSICGNGIVEAWEECDCGEDNEDCTEACCYPANAGQLGCRLKPSASCSPSEGPCCNSNCTFVKPVELAATCRFQTSCRQDAVCSGSRSRCPDSQAEADGTVCADGTMVCKGGQCSDSVCSKFNMEACQVVPELSTYSSCQVHCRRGRQSCRPSSQMSDLFPEALFYTNSQSCLLNDDLDFGTCSGTGECEALFKQSSLNLAIIIPILMVLLLALNCMLCIFCRYCGSAFKPGSHALVSRKA